jgi:hypothetical protein
MAKVLIGCEESQVVTKAFRDRGHEAYSCDLVPTRGNPDWHIQGDIMDSLFTEGWDLIILHPDCTKLAVSGNRWYGKSMKYHDQRIEAINWTVKLWNLATRYCDRVVLEQPVSVVFKHLEARTVQYIQPWQFGHGETKKTGLALHGLPELIPTNIVDGREQRIWKMAPGPNRKRDRSETFQGIADAMVDQWGNL